MAEQIKKVALQSGKVRYRFVVDAGRDANGKRKQLTVTKDTLKEARDELARIRHERSTGQLILPSKLTVSEWTDLWFEKKKEDLEETTIYNYRNVLLHIHVGLGGVRLQELTEEDCEEWVEWLLTAARRRGGPAGTGLRTSTADVILGRLKEILGRAVSRKILHTNVAQYVTIPRQAKKRDRRENEREKPWNVDEVLTFLDGIRGERLESPMHLSLMGERPAEVAGGRWAEDFDLVNGTVAVLNTRTMLGNLHVVEKGTKSTSGERTLPLPRFVWESAKRFKSLQAKERLAAGEAYTDSGYYFVDELGVPMTTRDLREAAYKKMDELGLRRVRLYDARHSVLTALAVSGKVDDSVLAAWAGHSNAAFTRARYVHPNPEDLRPAALVIDGLHEAARSRKTTARENL